MVTPKFILINLQLVQCISVQYSAQKNKKIEMSTSTYDLPHEWLEAPRVLGNRCLVALQCRFQVKKESIIFFQKKNWKHL